MTADPAATRRRGSLLSNRRVQGLAGGVVIGFLVGLLIFGKPCGLPPAWGDIPTWITAIATMLLAAFAVITAYYARQAFRTQSEQLADQKRVNTKQIDALNLQVRELRASLTERKRAQASKVDIRTDVGPDPRFGVIPGAASIPAPETVSARVTNDGDQPIYNAELIWDDGTLSYIEFTVWPGADNLALRIGPHQTASMTKRPTDTPQARSAVLRFRDAAGNAWIRTPNGYLMGFGGGPAGGWPGLDLDDPNQEPV